MRQLIRACAVSVAAVLFLSNHAAAQERVNADARVLADFQKRIRDYMAVREKAAAGAAKLKPTDDPAEIEAAQEALAARIRAARKDARPGDIFTREIRAVFRRLMYPETTGSKGQVTKAAIQDDAPARVPLQVNGEYPEGAPLPTVPPSVLANLPPLPKELEYRIVDRHLILLDVDANLIVDYFPNAIR